MVVTKKTSTAKPVKVVDEVKDTKVVEATSVKEVVAKPAPKKKAAAKKAAEPAQEDAVKEVVPVITPDAVKDVVVLDQAEDKVDDQEQSFNSLCSFVVELQQQLRTLNNDIRNLHRNYKKEVTVLRKQAAKKKRKVTDPTKKRAPSGFAKDTFLSNELRAFLDVPHGTLMSRPKVTKSITGYIRENNLYCESNKKIIMPNAKLGALLKHGDSEVTYFTLQKFMKVHYPKEQPSADDTTPVVVV